MELVQPPPSPLADHQEATAEPVSAAPELDPAKLVSGLRKADLPALLTVGFFVSMIGRKLTASGEGDPHA